MLVSEVHQKQDLKRSSRVHSSRAGINHEPKRAEGTEDLQGDLLCRKGQSDQAAVDKARLCLGMARLRINET